MTGRDAAAEHRVASQLELFFDLAFVVAVAFAAQNLHHDVVAHHYVDAAVNFVTGFFAIWWAWMNYTWFASAYDTDDVPFRLLTMVQMCGVVVLAIGIGDSGTGLGPIQVIGYVIMRMALVLQWLRAMREDGDHHDTCRRYAVGILLMQVYWIAGVVLIPEQYWLPAMAVGVAGELTVPRLAERAGPTPWHPHHIAERFGLFVIIVLGEGVLGMTNALASAIHRLGWAAGLVLVAPASIALLLGIWWSYFLAGYGDRLAEDRSLAWGWGYGHYAIFASLAAVGGGLQVAQSAIEHPHAVSATVATCSLAIPLGAFLLAKYAIHNFLWRRDPWYDRVMLLAFAVMAGIIGLARAGVDVQYLLAAFVLVPIVLVVPTERRARAADAAAGEC